MYSEQQTVNESIAYSQFPPKLRPKRN